uniref:Rho GTPase-activating protein 7 n=1 Tax=Myripristis murdjan TaxID=586833 RepID=A0A667WND2_9TELE
MPVAIRKRSWEDHVTHRSGLQYSYDDLDLVCCHGVDSEGPWIGTGGSKQGRRARCASMPECCHQPPTDDLAQALEATASAVDNECNKEGTECKNRSAPVKLDGIDEPKTLNENNGPTPHTQDIQGCSRPVRHDCEISSQTEQQNVEMAVLKQAQGEEGAQAEVNKKATEVSCGAMSSSDISIKGQSCSMNINNDISSEQLDVGYSKAPQVQMLTNTIPSTGQATVMETSLNQPTENVDGSTVSKDLIAEVQPSACQVQREHSRLDSMVLLLMKLDQLDQEIENALSATSSMDNTPTLHRRQLQVETDSLFISSSNPQPQSLPVLTTHQVLFVLHLK